MQKSELRKIFDFHKNKAGLKIARQISKEIVKKTENLASFPEMGEMEELLQERPQKFRYLVSTNYKIIYWINKDKSSVEVTDVFDTRQNPQKLERNS